MDLRWPVQWATTGVTVDGCRRRSGCAHRHVEMRSERSASTAHRRQHGRRFQRSRCDEHDAARVHGDARLVEPEQHGLGLDALDAQADSRWGAAATGRRARGRPRSSSSAQPSIARHPVRVSSGVDPLVASSVEVAVSSSAPQRSRRCSGHVLHAGAPRALLVAARGAAGSRRSPRRTSRAPVPGGAPNLWPETDTRSAPELGEVDRDTADRLRGVDVHEHPTVAARLDDLAHRLQRADLVVAPLQVHQRGRPVDRGEQLVGIDPTERSTPTGAHGPRSAHSRTAECSTARRARSGCRARVHRAVVRGGDRLGGARGEHDLAGSGADQRGELLPGVLERARAMPCPRVDPGPGRRTSRPAERRRVCSKHRDTSATCRPEHGEVDAWSST
jgi:hypothetical protein